MAYITPVTNHGPDFHPLPADFNRIEGNILQIKADTEAGKAGIAQACRDMGRSAAGDMNTYAQLAGHIRDISDDANGAVGDVLATKTFYQGGSKKTGTMPNNGPASAETVNLTSHNQEYTIASGFHSGLRKIKAVITNLAAGVIRAGVTVGGILGTFTADATGTAARILSGYTAGINGNLVAGTMPNRGAIVITPSAVNQAIPDGYHNGAGYVPGDPDLVAGNLPYNVNIFNVQGNRYDVYPGDNAVYTDPGTGSSGYNPFSHAYLYRNYAVQVNATGIYRVKYSIRPYPPSDSYTVYSQIFRNGAAHGTYRATSGGSFVTYSEDLFFNAGETVELYLGISSGGSGCQMQNFILGTAQGPTKVL